MDPKEKLQSLPPVLYINLDRQPLRKAAFEQQCVDYGITNFSRIEAFDGKDPSMQGALTGEYPSNLSVAEVGCVLSHLKALKHFVYETDHERMLICEDDLSFEMANCWQFSWHFFESHLPFDRDIVQLAVINPTSVYLYAHIRFVNDFSTACYLITRRYAEKLLALHCVGDRYRIDQGVRPRPVADQLLYNAGRAYSIPLFGTFFGSEGSVNPENYSMHEHSNKVVYDFWNDHARDPQPNYAFLWDYNPLTGQLPPEEYTRKNPNQ